MYFLCSSYCLYIPSSYLIFVPIFQAQSIMIPTNKYTVQNFQLQVVV